MIRLTYWLLLLGCVGCAAESSFEPTAKPPHAMQPKRPSEVRVVSEPAHAQGVEVGRIEVTSEPHYSWDPQTDQTLGLLRQEAAQRGCDAIQVGPADSNLFMMGSTPMHRTTQSARCFVTP